MIPQITIAYLTCRVDPNLNWFIDSIKRQNSGSLEGIKLIVVDHHANSPNRRTMLGIDDDSITLVEPKPNVWNGPFKLTKEDWFNPASARNTALCLCETSHLCYVDDLSIPSPTWLLNVKQACTSNLITLGSYRKIKNAVVENGFVCSFDNYPQGHDSRFAAGMDNASVPCGGEWLFGCSLVAPVEALLTVGGWPESLCGGLGFEDSIMGLALENAGFKFQYSRSMLTYESEEHHHLDPSFKRSDYGVSPNDKSHAVLNIAQSGCRYFENCYEGGMRKMREEVLSGKPFPIIQCPDREWYTGRLLSEL